MKGIKIDFITNTIIITKSFYEATQDCMTEEYNSLQRIIKENPDMKVALRSSRSGCHASNYKGLTYDYMRRFIRNLDRNNIAVFEEVKGHFENIYTDTAKVYQCVKDWFLENYPEHKSMVVDSVPRKVSDNNNLIYGSAAAVQNNVA